jgi:hypothetical protein
VYVGVLDAELVPDVVPAVVPELVPDVDPADPVIPSTDPSNCM